VEDLLSNELLILKIAVGGLVSGVGSMGAIALASIKLVGHLKRNGTGHSSPCKNLETLMDDVREAFRDLGDLKTKNAVAEKAIELMAKDVEETKLNSRRLVEKLLSDHKTDPGT